MILSITKDTLAPVSLEEAKLHLRIDTDDDDTFIEALIATATELVEKETNIDLVVTQSVYAFEDFENPLVIPRCPVVAITNLQYNDIEGILQTLTEETDYIVTNPINGKCLIEPNPYTAFPPVFGVAASVFVSVTSGYGYSGYTVPNIAKQAILLMIGEWYENRENSVEANLKTLSLGVERLLAQLTIL